MAWHQISHISSNPDTSSINDSSENLIKANILFKEMQADTFAAIATAQGEGYDHKTTTEMIDNLASNRLSRIDTTDLDSTFIHFTLPAMESLKFLINEGIISPQNMTLKEAHNLSSNIAFFALSADYTPLVKTQLLNQDPSVFSQYLIDIADDIRCNYCGNERINYFAKKIQNYQLYPSVRQVMLELYLKQDQIPKLSADDYAALTGSIEGRISNTPGMTDYRGVYRAYDTQTITTLGNEDLKNNHKPIQRLMSKGLVQSFSADWLAHDQSRLYTISRKRQPKDSDLFKPFN